jgi:hypothetical protein
VLYVYVSMIIVRSNSYFSSLSLLFFTEGSVLKCACRTIYVKQRNIVTNFGIPVIVIEKTWELMDQFDTIHPKLKQKTLLWAYTI